MAYRDKDFFEKINDNLIVCGVPNTGNDYAITYSNTIGIHIKNIY